eukprot:3592408-Amphidinium_carterae.1
MAWGGMVSSVVTKAGNPPSHFVACLSHHASRFKKYAACISRLNPRSKGAFVYNNENSLTNLDHAKQQFGLLQISGFLQQQAKMFS